MSKRRIQALQTLRRLEERQLNELARHLTLAQSTQASALAEVEALQNRAIIEGSTTAPEAMPYVGKFLAALRKEQSRAQEVARGLEQQIEALRENVMVHFSAERSLDNLAKANQAQMTKERQQKAESALEDLIQARFGRNK